MTVRELQEMLAKWPHSDAKVVVRVDGSIFGTDNVQEHIDYNDEGASEVPEFYVLAVEDFE